MQFVQLKRRDFMMLLRGAAAAWPLAALAQQPAMPIVGVVGGGGGDDTSTRYVTAFRKGLNGNGIIEGQNVTVEYYWLRGQYDRLPSLMADLVRRRVAVIVTPGSNPATLAAKAATTTIPIVFGVAEDPVKLGLVASLARPGGNMTGVNMLFSEIVAKRLGLLHDLVPKAVARRSSIRPMLLLPRPCCETYRKVPASSGCKFSSSTPARVRRSMRLSQPSRATGPMRSSSPPTHSSPVAALNLPRWRRATGCRRVVPTLRWSKPAC